MKTRIRARKRFTESDNKFDIFFIYKTEAKACKLVRDIWKKLDKKEIVCGFHEKDFIPGVTISENIVQCVKRSRKIAVIITPEFKESEWCKYDLDIALNDKIKSGESLIIPLHLNLTDQEQIPDALQIFTVLDVSGEIEEWWEQFIQAVDHSKENSIQRMEYHAKELLRLIKEHPDESLRIRTEVQRMTQHLSPAQTCESDTYLKNPSANCRYQGLDVSYQIRASNDIWESNKTKIEVNFGYVIIASLTVTFTIPLGVFSILLTAGTMIVLVCYKIIRNLVGFF